MKTFFRYLIIGFLISSVRASLIKTNSFDTIKTISYSFLYNFITGIYTGLSAMFIHDFYLYLKKNENEYRNCCL